eukprot:GSChrysophyteH1.ASY1.ANO1.2231.1 assembled CDS
MPPRRLPSRSSVLAVTSKRASLSLTSPNINHLVRIYLLDGSSKVLQGTDSSTVADMLEQLKYNMDLGDISTCALFRVVEGQSARRMELGENMKEAMKDTHELDSSGTEVRILFRTWIHAKGGLFDREVFQYHDRHKTHNSAIWLAYMEANFMCMTGRYYLSEDESILLGCLKMQADSGDFDPEKHTIGNIMERVCTRFPRPVSTQMRALMSPTLYGNGMAEELASRVQFLYARIAGKHKAEAQIEFLQSLRTWCPFYGGTFFTVQSQFDDGSADAEPPVQTMNVAIGPLAVFLITQTEPLVILRHPYKRIVKWIAYRDKHIFCYWVLKKAVSLTDVEMAKKEEVERAHREGRAYKVETDFDASVYCDCAYLVTPSCAELEYLVRSYVAMLKNDTLPKLKGAKGDLLPPDVYADASLNSVVVVSPAPPPGVMPPPPPPPPAAAAAGASRKASKDKANKRRKSRGIGALFTALGGYSTTKSEDGDSPATTDGTPDGTPRQNEASNDYISNIAGGSGIGSDSADEDANGGSSGFGDDCAGASSKSNLFRNVYASPYRRDSSKTGSASPSQFSEGDDESTIPPQIQFAASMSELQRLAAERFSDDDENDESDVDDGADDSDSNEDGDSIINTKGGGVTVTRQKPASAFRRVSAILFGGGQKSQDKSSGAGSEVGGSSESEYETDTDTDDSD